MEGGGGIKSDEEIMKEPINNGILEINTTGAKGDLRSRDPHPPSRPAPR